MSPRNLIEYWQPDLVREAGEIAIKIPRDHMEDIMVQATEFMEQLPWKGAKKAEDQTLAWPRRDVTLKDGTLISDTDVPEAIMECSIKVSYFIAAGIPFDIPALTHVMLTIGHLLIPDADVKKDNLMPWQQTVH